MCNLLTSIILRERIEIDKKKLLEIARRNAINMIKQGTLPLVQQDKAIAAIQAGGKTVDELTGIYILIKIIIFLIMNKFIFLFQIFVNHYQNLKH